MSKEVSIKMLLAWLSLSRPYCHGFCVCVFVLVVVVFLLMVSISVCLAILVQSHCEQGQEHFWVTGC